MNWYVVVLSCITIGTLSWYAGYYLGWSQGAAWMRSAMRQIWTEERESNG
jgi:hypothetical protein